MFVAHQFGHLWAYRWRVSNYRQCAATIQAVGRAIKRQNLCTTLVQFSTAYYLRNTPFWSWKFWILAYVIGGTANPRE
jgi:hypothetical protein